MFNGRKKIYKTVLQTQRDYSEDISYRGEGLSNEHRPLLPRGLVGFYQKRHAKKLLDILKKEIQT